MIQEDGNCWCPSRRTERTFSTHNSIENQFTLRAQFVTRLNVTYNLEQIAHFLDESIQRRVRQPGTQISAWLKKEAECCFFFRTTCVWKMSPRSRPDREEWRSRCRWTGCRYKVGDALETFESTTNADDGVTNDRFQDQIAIGNFLVWPL